ncbi:MAG: ribonuclease III [Eubacteriaceae bacterium]|nr:ribonuclease III [Eubacteriaceae bacterium]
MNSKPDFSELEELLRYHFKDSDLLRKALTHPSAVNETKAESNQRLEFLGDAVLQLAISANIYEAHPDLNEGSLSKIRSMIVCADSLYIGANGISLSDFLILGKGEELNGGRSKKNILADSFESVIGAIFLDGGFDAAEEFIIYSLSDIISQASDGSLTYDYKTTLQEYAQALDAGELEYELVRIEGPEHEQIFYSRAVLGNRAFGEAFGHNRKHSEQNAAELALRELKVID